MRVCWRAGRIPPAAGNVAYQWQVGVAVMTRKARAPKNSARPKLVMEISRPEDAVVDPVWTAYFDGRPFEVSRAACGYTVDEWVSGGKDFFKRVLTPESLTTIRAATFG